MVNSRRQNSADGVYVHYPFDELMAILAIESQHNQCLIIGEDLGTVPDEVRWKLNEFEFSRILCCILLNVIANIHMRMNSHVMLMRRLVHMTCLPCKVSGIA